MRTARPLLLATALAAGFATTPATAAAADTATRRIESTSLSFSGFDHRLPRGAVVSVIQTCPTGSSLDKARTRAQNRELDAEVAAEPNVRLASRELWVAGLVTRYRVVRAGGVPTEDGFGLASAAVCAQRVPVTARTVAGRGSTDVRVWGPAPAGAQLYTFTGVFVSDGPPTEDGPLPFVSRLRATGVGPSAGALRGGVRAVQQSQDDGVPLVIAEGTTRRSVTRGQFVSMRSSYAVATDLTRRQELPERADLLRSPGSG